MLLSKYMTGDIHSRFGGRAVFKGGGGAATTSSGIDPEFKPHLKKALGAATSKLEHELGAGGSAVADQTRMRNELEGRLARDPNMAVDQALRRTGADLAGQQALGGALGSARAQRARQAALGDVAYQRQAQEDAARMQALQGLQASEQAQLDAPHTALSRYFGYLGNAPQQSTTTQQGGK